VNEALLAAFSEPTQRVLRALAGKPEDAAAFYNRLTIFRAGLMIGREVMEAQLRSTKDKHAGAILEASIVAILGNTTALECTMTTLENLHPELGKINVSNPPKARDHSNGTNRIRPIELD